ncbi:helix-turn-helix domain-containing protein [Rhodopirellula sp. JC740]|uniref:Helix-turn-helix domain-containing protein n=1 Tax=Rhodopirellula halodulae TaxID=2894198 RepID=A0ABS8NN37_9BACT|nr:helix-turn-helix domain-containing protein [Rhodopirellula sp. JC740]MCC9644997.1 helix-turn-helix domain-containing protein [Rhodopirellula sp. JC740]
MESDLLSLKEAAPLVGMSVDSLRELAKRDEIEHVRIGPKNWLYRFRREWLDDYIESQRRGGPSARREQSQKRRLRLKPDRTKVEFDGGQESILSMVKKFREEMKQRK